jgi:hypothetical protein
MKLAVSLTLLLALSAPLALAKDKKKNEPPAVFSTARYVYIQCEDGDVMNHSLFPEDREAILNAQDAVRDWNRYSITLNRKDADLVFIVRKGRLVAARVGGDIGIGNPPDIGGGGVSYPNRNPVGPGNTNPGNPGSGRTSTSEGIGGRGEAGPTDDTLRIFISTPDGKLTGPIWSREMKEGLDSPDVLLIRALKESVERAYPPQPASPPAKQP